MQSYSQIVECERCHIVKPLMEMSQCSFRGKVSYECPSRNNCKTKEEIKQHEEEIKSKELISKYSHLSKENQIEAMYGVNFDDLDEHPMRMRDASIHYYHDETDTYYSWCWGDSIWRKTNKSIRMMLEK